MDYSPDLNNNHSSTRTYQIIIIVFMFIITVLLAIAAVVVVNKNKTQEDEYLGGSRTIMIYIDGSNLESNNGIVTNELDSIVPSEVDLENMSIYIYTGGTEKWHNYISNEENAIYKLTSDGFTKQQTYEQLNMGDASTLSEFLNYVYNDSTTDYYDLIFYDHGGALRGAIQDSFTGDMLSLDDFEEALTNSPFNSQNKLESVIFRTCLNGTLEVASVFDDYAAYLVSSEEVTLGAPYTSVLNFLNDIEVTDTGIEYCKKFINAYSEQISDIKLYNDANPSVYSLVDLKNVKTLMNEFDEFISGIDIVSNYNDIVKIRADLFQFGYTNNNSKAYDTVDLYSLINELSEYSSVSNEDVLDAFGNAVIYNWTEMDDANGLSIYFPYIAGEKYSDYYLPLVESLGISDNYYSLINKFYSIYTSGGTSSYETSTLVENETTVSDTYEFTLNLTDDEVKDYAESLYIIFKKEDDGEYTVIYSSDNTELTGNTLKTNIGNNLVRFKTTDGEYFYIPIIERNSTNNKVYFFGSILENFTADNVSDWKMDSAWVYIDYDESNKPYIKNAILEDEDDSLASGIVLDLNDYTTYAIVSSHYNILDESGNYTENWDNGGTVRGYEIKKDELILENASLDDMDAEYYCVFKVYDVYGNSYYSKLMSLQ